jgi:hypothetical protein
MLAAPKMPDSGASASVPGLQAEVEPSRAYTRDAASACEKPGRVQAASWAAVTLGIAPMSA